MQLSLCASHRLDTWLTFAFTNGIGIPIAKHVQPFTVSAGHQCLRKRIQRFSCLWLLLMQVGAFLHRGLVSKCCNCSKSAAHHACDGASVFAFQHKVDVITSQYFPGSLCRTTSTLAQLEHATTNMRVATLRQMACFRSCN